MKEPTYSVFVRFRRGQRLTLKRAAPLDVALRFATEVRAERFHNADDVFIIDDASGNTVAEAQSATNGVVETIPDQGPSSDVHQSDAAQKSDLQTLLAYVGRWQLRHAQLTIRGGQRLTATVEWTLAQLTRLLENLARSKLFDADMARIIEETTLAVEQVRKVRDGLHQVGVKLQIEPTAEQMDATNVEAINLEKPPEPSKRKQARAKS